MKLDHSHFHLLKTWDEVPLTKSAYNVAVNTRGEANVMPTYTYRKITMGRWGNCCYFENGFNTIYLDLLTSNNHSFILIEDLNKINEN